MAAPFESPRPPTIRSQFMLEVASELVAPRTFLHQQARIQLRAQGSADSVYTLSGSDAPSALDEVGRREIDVGIVNPGGPLTMAYRGKGPFSQPIPVRAITVIPSRDWLGFAVHESTGLTSLADVKRQKYPLRISLRAQRDHATHLYVNEVLKAYGFSLSDVVEWGGQISYDASMPVEPLRMGKAQAHEVDAIFDESLTRFIAPATEAGLRFLPLEEPILQQMEDLGFRRSVVTRAQFPSLPADVPCLDFSGWPVFTHADTSEDFVYAFCRALDARRDRIPYQQPGPLPLERMCRDTPEGPLDVPLHPGAERYWREAGYL